MEMTPYTTAFPKRWHYYLNGTEIEEPLDWEDVVFEFARNKDSDGIVMMPSIPIRLGGEGAEIVRRWVYSRRVDEKITLRIAYLELDGSETVYFEGDLSDEAFVDHADSIEIQTEESGLENVINANAKVVYEIPTTDGGPGGTQTYTRYDRIRMTLDYLAVNRDGVTRIRVPAGGSTLTEIAVPFQIERDGDFLAYSTAAPDLLEAKRDGRVTLTVDNNFFYPVSSGEAAAAQPYAQSDPDNDHAVGLAGKVSFVGAAVYPVEIRQYATDGTLRRTFFIKGNASQEIRVDLRSGDLLTAVITGFTLQTTSAAPNDTTDNYLNLTWKKDKRGDFFIKVTDASYYRGEPVDIPDISLTAAFIRLMRLASGRPDLNVVYDLGAGVLNLSQRLFTTGHIVGRDSGVIKASFEDFRKWFDMLGYGVVFEFFGGVERCRVVDKYRTGKTSPLWPLDASARIADVGDGWHDMDLQFNEEQLFTAVELGFDKVKDYKLIPYKSDPCGKSTYTNAQDKSSTVLQTLTDWRADGYGIEDILLQAEANGAGSVGDLDTVWIMDCDVLPVQTSPYYAYAPYRGENGGLAMPGADASTLVNMGIRPASLLRLVQPRLAIPVSFLQDKSYAFASASNRIELTTGGLPDSAPLDVREQPANLPLYAAFSSSIRTNLWATMQDVAKRYGFITFDYRGVTLKGFVWSVKYNPTEESSQRCELYLTPDSDLPGLIK